MYKLNQIEGALNALLSGKPSSAGKRLGSPIPKVLKTQIKRLLEIDRERARALKDAGHNGDDGVAFFDVLPEGKGTDAQYDEFGAACLAVGLELLWFGFKQREVVSKIAAVRGSLRKIHRQLMEDVVVLGPTYGVLHGENLPRKPAGRNRNKDVPDFSWFLVLDAVETAGDLRPERFDQNGRVVTICRGRDLPATLEQIIPQRRIGCFIIQVSEPMLRMRELLDQQPARVRGRS